MSQLCSRLLAVATAAALLATPCPAQTPAPYRDSTLSIDARVKDLLGRMTLEEKFWQLFMIPGDLDDPAYDYSHGVFGLQISTKPGNGDVARAHAQRINDIQRYFVEHTRLGIPIIPFDEAVHGLMRDGATVFPQAIGLAATFDTSMMDRVAHAIASETRSRGVRLRDRGGSGERLRRDTAERLRLRAPVVEVRIRWRNQLSVRSPFAQEHESVWLGVRKWSEEDRVQYRERGGRRTDAECERQHRQRGESGLFS